MAVLVRVTPTSITDDVGRTPIHAASLRGHKHVIEYLEASGWKLDITDKEGNTALHMSGWFGSLKVVQYLMEAKLNPYKKNKAGLTPLDFAVREGHHEIERLLMKRRGGSSIKLQHTQQLIVSVSSLILTLHLSFLFIHCMQRFCDLLYPVVQW